MTTAVGDLGDLEEKIRAGVAPTREDAERIVLCADLVSVGAVGQAARARQSAERVTFGRVAVVHGAVVPKVRGSAGEVRIVGTPASMEEARAWVRNAAPFADGVPLTGFSLFDLVALADGNLQVLTAHARELRRDGLEAIAETPIDVAGSTSDLVATGLAAIEGGLGVWRLTVDRARLTADLDLMERAVAAAGPLSVRAFAPLARHDSPEAPSTGYDDVRAVAVASVWCRDVAAIQVDWPLYGPKLAQVAIIYGANDIDGVDSADDNGLGVRRSPLEDIRRQIRSAGGTPVERNGRFETLT